MSPTFSTLCQNKIHIPYEYFEFGVVVTNKQTKALKTHAASIIFGLLDMQLRSARSNLRLTRHQLRATASSGHSFCPAQRTHAFDRAIWFCSHLLLRSIILGFGILVIFIMVFFLASVPIFAKEIQQPRNKINELRHAFCQGYCLAFGVWDFFPKPKTILYKGSVI